MKVHLVIDGVAATLDLTAPAPACRFRLADDAERIADVQVPESNVYSVLMDGRSYEARVEPSATGLVVVIDGYRFQMAVRDPRVHAAGAGGARADGTATVAAPMPGKVVRVLVAVGDAVEKGQGVVVVEAMKMQNEMQAPRAGKVASLSAAAGAIVAAGEVLATIE